MSQISSKNKGNLLIVALVVVALVLGVFIYKQNQGSLPNFALKQSKNTSPTNNASGKSSKDATYTKRRPTPAGLTSQEKELLSPPAPDASQEIKTKHFNLVKTSAKTADVLDLNACQKPSPLVLLLNKGQDFKVSNQDKDDHTVIIDRDHQYKVPAGTTQTFKADFGRGTGAYGYLCDGLGGVVGFFFVAK